MDTNKRDELIGNIKSTLDTHSHIALALDASEAINGQVYNETDLLNATQIFMHILWNVSIGHWISKWFTQEQMILIAEEMGKNIKQTIQLSTGIDIPTLVNKLYK